MCKNKLCRQTMMRSVGHACTGSKDRGAKAKEDFPRFLYMHLYLHILAYRCYYSLMKAAVFTYSHKIDVTCQHSLPHGQPAFRSVRLCFEEALKKLVLPCKAKYTHLFLVILASGVDWTRVKLIWTSQNVTNFQAFQ